MASHFFLIGPALLLLLGGNATNVGKSSAPAAGKIDFQRDIRPILSNFCFKCHGPALHESGMRLDLRDWALKRKVIVPGNPDLCRLIARVSSADDEERMPPPYAGKRLSADQIAKLRAWIEQGAEYTPHWAFLTPRAAPLPAVKDAAWPRNGIDPFILARLEQAGLKPSPEAAKATLIRRLYLDLLGLLPEPAEVDAFLKDTRQDAYERLVDRLLDSPHYGERQARHWLDLARYADSNGYTIDGMRSIWPYRDWVIAAFNRDLPFDQFTIEQLAGDLLPKPTRAQLIATGFHRNTPFNEEGGTDQEQFRVERTVDRTNTTGTVWLGLTVGCAQCHTHKYDPITHEEYYRLYAFFNTVDEPQLSLGSDEQDLRLRELNGLLAKAKAAKNKPARQQGALEEIASELRKDGGWKILDPTALKSVHGTLLTRQADLSILAGGKTPETETYTVETTAPGGPVTAIRLEALTHASLPHNGPGRAGNGNFVLSHLTLALDGQEIAFRQALADHSQKDYDVAAALLGDPKRGWAINVEAGTPNVKRQAIFILEKPVTTKQGQRLTFTLRFSEWPKRYPLGRFRLAVSAAPDRFVSLPLVAQKILLLAPDRRSTEENASLEEILLGRSEAVGPAPEMVKRLQQEIKGLQTAVPTTLILREHAKGRPTNIHLRGDFLSKGDLVQPGTLACLPPLSTDGRPANRLDLARWLVRPDQPLTGRVLVNRMWQHYFGAGLVETENDLGMQGASPTHPELLDWLAVELVQRGWSVKAMHRLIVTSATYRQSSAVRADLAEKDPRNQLLGRQARIRVDAEIIRDAALSASGLLSPKVGGPGVFPPQPAEVFSFTQSRQVWPESKGPDRFRRGLYTFLWRQSQHPLVTTFDGPDAQTACTRRNRSNTPLQALHLANDPTFVEFAEGLARRITAKGPSDDEGRMRYAFRVCLCREPGPEEQDRLLRFLHEQRQMGGERAWTMVARVLLNLDEFITRE